MSILKRNNKINAAELLGLPSFMADGELAAGRVESSCTLHVGLPGVPNMVNPVNPEFLHMLNDLDKKVAAYGKNSVGTMAEDTVNSVKYAMAFVKGKVYAMANSKPVDKAKIPARLVFLLAMPTYCQYAEFRQAYAEYKAETDDNKKKLLVAAMYDTAYYVEKPESVTAIFESMAITSLNSTKVGDDKFAPTEVEGNFEVFKMPANGTSAPNIATAQAVMDGSAFNGKYAVVDPSELTAEECEHIFRIDDRFIVTEQHVDICSTIKGSLGGKHPFSNFLLRGAPGGGKSTFVQIVAAGTALPYYSDVLRDDITADFFSGYYAPDCDHMGKHIGLDEFIANMPSPEDMTYDPISAYMQITGETNESVSPQDCMNALMKKVKEVSGEAKGESKAALTFVEGLVPKLTRPCLIFYDEVTVPKNPGVIAALNTLMDNQRKFTLTSGRVIERHPKSVMMFAGNFGDVEGCREPNRAWQDRNNEILDVAPPTPEQMKAMLIASTGYDENVNGNIPINTFVSIWPELQKISKDYYGVCGPRALCDWLAKSMILGNPVQAAKTTIIAKSSNDESCQAAMMTKIVNRFKI